jgi:diguanylate cyclase (GGDEF)-like protein
MSARWLRFALAALIALTLASLLVLNRFNLETTRHTLGLNTDLLRAADQLEEGLLRGMEVAEANSGPVQQYGWHRWKLDQPAAALLPPIPEEQLRRLLAGRTTTDASPTVLLGPVALPAGGDVVLLAHAHEPDGGDAHQWQGAWRRIDAVMALPTVEHLLKRGVRLQLLDAGTATPMYQSDSLRFESALAVPLNVAGASLELHGVNRDRWVVPARLLSPSLLVLLAVLGWLTYEMYRVRALQRVAEAAAEADARREELNLRYGEMLQGVSELESRLQVAHLYDGATGLANRKSLLHRIGAALESMRDAHGGQLCVMAIGFDQAHHIASTFGADFAARVLVAAAERIRAAMPAEDLVFRTGDLNLAAVLPDMGPVRGQEIARLVVEAAEAPITLDNHTILLHPGVGIATAESGYEQPEALIDQANSALQAIARDAPERHCLFNSATARDSAERMQLVADLGRAFEESQFVLEFEPFIVPVAQSVAGFEALIRWNHPTEGRLPPGKFLPVAVEAGMSHRLNSEVFVNFNITAEAFLRPNLVEEVAALLAEFQLPGRMLVVELTESTLVQDMRAAARTLHRLNDLGVRTWLDDFGTGYSSLGHLRALPLSAVKIDRSFVERIDIDARDFGFLKALIDLISYLGMQSIVEGLESASQFELLSMTSCDLYQGHYFSASLPAGEAGKWISRRGIGMDKRRSSSAQAPLRPSSTGRQ